VQSKTVRVVTGDEFERKKRPGPGSGRKPDRDEVNGGGATIHKDRNREISNANSISGGRGGRRRRGWDLPPISVDQNRMDRMLEKIGGFLSG
jgi:hypothetical protein